MQFFWVLQRPNSINTWDQLKEQFVNNYRVTCKQPGMKYDLERLRQGSRDSLRDYIRHFSEIRNDIPDITDAEAISAFMRGLRPDEELRKKLYRTSPTTIPS